MWNHVGGEAPRLTMIERIEIRSMTTPYQKVRQWGGSRIPLAEAQQGLCPLSTERIFVRSLARASRVGPDRGKVGYKGSRRTYRLALGGVVPGRKLALM